MRDASPLLRIEDASVRFGGVRALDGVSCEVREGEICGLIGPNGAGKTTLFNCVTRLYALAGGAITFDGARIDRVPARAIVSLGIARTFQNLGIYPDMSVLENVLLGAHHSHGGRFFHRAGADHPRGDVTATSAVACAYVDLSSLSLPRPPAHRWPSVVVLSHP